MNTESPFLNRLQFLWELHFIEAQSRTAPRAHPASLLQFLWELHFIEARYRVSITHRTSRLQFLWELHFIEAFPMPRMNHIFVPGCSSFGNCTSLRRDEPVGVARVGLVAVPLGTALH